MKKSTNKNKNQEFIQNMFIGNASTIINPVLNTHFGTDKKQFECRLFDNGNYILSSFHHSEFLAWTAGKNWEMLSKSKSFKLN